MRRLFAKSLLPRFIAIFVAFAVLQSLVTFLFTYSLYSGALIDKNVRANEQKLEQITSNLETVIEVAVAASNQVCLDYDNAELLQQPYDGFYGWYKDRMQPLKKRLDSVQSGALYRYDSSVYLFGLAGDTYSTGKSSMTDMYGVTDTPWFRRVLSEQGYLMWMLSDDQFRSLPGGDKDIAVLRAVRSENGQRTVGVLLITMQLQGSLRRLFFENEDGQALFMLGQDGNIALGSDGTGGDSPIDWPSILGSQTDGSLELSADGNQLFVNVCTIYKTGWRLVQVLNERVFFRQIDALKTSNLLVNSALAAVVALLLALFTKRAIDPLRTLTRLLHQVGEGNFELAAPESGQDELAQIGASFNAMVARVRELLQRVKQEHKQQEKILLGALRAQINPHFLLNTLNDIKWMALIQNDKQVASMLATLGTLLENTLGRHDKFIPLRAELKNTASYARLQSMRFGDKFALTEDVDASMLDALVPILILQPLIENAVLHGFCDMESGGQIHLTGRLERANDIELMTIEVRDNGQGISQDRLEHLKAAMDDLYADDTGNIGLANVHRRLVLSYGRDYGLTIASAPGEGTTVRLVFPKNMTE